MTDEGDLARRLAEGDDDAWTRFLDVYGPRVVGMVRHMMRRRLGRAGAADVDEVAGEVFLALLADDAALLRRYDPTRSLATWLAVVARTVLGRYLRRRGPPPVESLEAAPQPDGVEGATLAARREEVAALSAALERLGPRDRLLLRLRFQEGLSYARIAEALGVEASSVGPLLARAKARLRTLWTEP